MGAFRRKRLFLSFFILIQILMVWGAVSLRAEPSPVKNIIVMVADGMGAAHTTIARWHKGSPLALDEMLVGGIRTYSAESLITDSAPGATAFATGHKSNDKFIGILPEKTLMPGVPPVADNLKTKPVATVLEGAKLQGKAVGLVATSNIQHATPAAYSSHTPDRRDYNDIAKQQVYQNMDVVLGGGRKYLLPKRQDGTRPNPENLIEVLKGKGYAFVQTREELLRFEGKKVWGLFADHDMAYELDRRLLRPDEPSLAEMTRVAIRILSSNEKGFFLFVEGSKIDWASHAHDPIGIMSDLLAFDEAVAVALDFAKKDGKTLILALSDHATAGMSLGNQETDRIYDKLPVESLRGPLKKAILTGEGLEKVLGEDRSEGKIVQTLTDFYGLSDLSQEEIQAIQKFKKGQLNSVVGPMLSKRTPIGWTTSRHTGEDLFLYAYGPNRPVGLLENTEIAHLCARSFQFDLAVVDRRLFSPAEEVFQDLEAKMWIDEANPSQRALVVEKGAFQARFPFSQNVMQVGNRTWEMEGLTVWAPKIKKVFLPREARELAKRAGM